MNSLLTTSLDCTAPILTRDGDGVVLCVAGGGVGAAVDALDVEVVLGAEAARLVGRDDDVGGHEEGAVLRRRNHVVRHVPHARVQGCIDGKREVFFEKKNTG